ncbi:hypothetical protein GXP67_21115 [Rhodocytophaga rosea]|uniref:Uncharacterized protein n=1 Tax=Rhodocytophaga rosea TaxID=2704465 RepID=A0A6C0GLL3_9BACT|nr:hypothetical protein [Rhodocytophaga rosea]QHT68971.1 hypothetical protein GXP67_21115 [Rhodocytophaga rosea]
MSNIEKKPELVHPFFIWDLLEVKGDDSPTPYKYYYPENFNGTLYLPEEIRKALIDMPFEEEGLKQIYYAAFNTACLVLIPEIHAYNRKDNTLFSGTTPIDLIDDYFLFQLTTFERPQHALAFLDYQYYYTENKIEFIRYAEVLIRHAIKKGSHPFNKRLDIYDINLDRLKNYSEYIYDWIDNHKEQPKLPNRVITQNGSKEGLDNVDLIPCELEKFEIAAYFMQLAAKKILTPNDVEELLQSNFSICFNPLIPKKRFAVKAKIKTNHLRHFVYRFFKDKAKYKPGAKRYTEFLIDNFDTESDNIQERESKLKEIEKNWQKVPAKYDIN